MGPGGTGGFDESWLQRGLDDRLPVCCMIDMDSVNFSFNE